MNKTSFCCVLDYSGGDSALLPPGIKCLDRGQRHCPPGPCAVLCGDQIIPSTKKHPGEFPFHLGFQMQSYTGFPLEHEYENTCCI